MTEVGNEIFPFILNVLSSPISLYIGSAIILAILLSPVYSFFFKPLRCYKTFQEMGGTKGHRKPGACPPPYPSGWFRVLFSFELQKGQAIDVELCGRHLVVFRSNDEPSPTCKVEGKATEEKKISTDPRRSKDISALDAYCPHLGANLAIGGVVRGNCIECPFHGWQFRGSDGLCVNIPYSDRAPPTNAKTHSWPVWEGNGIICIYYDGDDPGGENEPAWYPPSDKECEDGTWTMHGTSKHQVAAHIQEMPENGADTAHLGYLHMPFVVQWAGAWLGLSHSWTCSWTPGKDDEWYLTNIDLSQYVNFMGKRLDWTRLPVKIQQIGPGLVYLKFATPIGPAMVLECVSPQEPLLQNAGHIIWGGPWIPRFVAKIVLQALISQFERDIPIWNNKTFEPKPMVVSGDGPIIKYRRWFSQFYPKKAPPVTDLGKEGEW